jgi:hypothetical protein
MTYSLASVCVLASDQFPATGGQPQLPDANALTGGQQNAMRNGTQVLCKMPDGSLKYCTIDPTRWVPGQTPYVLPVGP